MILLLKVTLKIKELFDQWYTISIVLLTNLMGLSGLGYNGHVFWDMDLWMYPAILVLNPKLAKSLIEYRYDRLEAAKNNAYLNGYKGAMFPW
jgi:trehalose/maltose hydrolase-like predicted phosphorylase